jgi:hypothetical protein
MPLIDECRVLGLTQVPRPEGNITPVEGGADPLPFEIARVFYLYDIPGGADRGGHAHYRCEQLLVCVMGSFRVVIEDGVYQRVVELNRANYGLYVPPMIWGAQVEFSAGAICVVLASLPYDEADYIRDHDRYLQLRREAAPA